MQEFLWLFSTQPIHLPRNPCHTALAKPPAGITSVPQLSLVWGFLPCWSCEAPVLPKLLGFAGPTLLTSPLTGPSDQIESNSVQQLIVTLPPGIMLGKSPLGLWEVCVPIREADHTSPLSRKCVGFDTQTPLSCVTMLPFSYLLVVEIMWWKIIKYKGKASICLPMISIIQSRRRWELPHFIHMK